MYHNHGLTPEEGGDGEEEFQAECHSQKCSPKSVGVFKLRSSLVGWGPLSHKNDLHWSLHYAWSLAGSSPVGIDEGRSKKTGAEAVEYVPAA